ncbi:MAG: response regulator [Butyrivibrio sp.]|uniref:response regulator transcription factor n=1 Tax=Butyrivibrio sp. TaxID=28121 RepID=UPI0025CF5ABF|nr:response regulator [Butyrivibrio sp.]MCR5771469.1 response regulator [Butyrivibrio sp.]
MIKIMIVDDMPIFLEYLKGCIDWNSYGFEICCEAHDGKEALEMLDQYYPDVVLTDITMPYINGLELAEKITADYKDISVILITGNNEFEYARKAVKIGVCDYIVKPFEKEELIMSLLKLQDNIGKAVENTLEEPEKDNLEEKLKALIYAGVGQLDEDEIKSYSLFYDNEEKAKKALESSMETGFLVGLVKFDFTKLTEKTRITLEDFMNWEKLIAKMLEDKIDIEGSFKVFHDYENNIVVIMRFDDNSQLDSFKGYEFSDIIDVIKSQLGINCAIGLAKAGNIRSIKSTYENLMVFLNNKSSGQFYDIRNSENSLMNGSLDAILRLNKDLETLQEDDVESVINDLWNNIKTGNSQNDSSGTFDVMNLLSSAISILMTNIISNGFSIEKIYGESFSPEKYLAFEEGPEKMKEKVIYLYKKRIEFEKAKKNSKTYDVASTAKKYIEENFSNSSLSISDISEKLCVNQTYLRKMFKSQMDMTLSEYITQYRMQEAKKLITTTDEKLSVVAEKVGFSDVSYFSNVFKKYYGISPRSMSRG